VIDTGIAVAYDQSELNVDRAKSVECNPGGCGAAPDPTKTADDTSGHGTAVAGIIGARNNGTMTAGVVPNVVLVAVQVSVKGEIKWSSLYNALEHLLNSADFASGDVINISLGATWNPNPNSIEREIEQQILNLAAVKSARIAMAAGNLDALDGTAYLPTVTPARAAIFPKPANGAVMAVSAVDANDAFWPDSGFGNGKEPNTGGVYVGPPEVAEPGVGIATLGLKPNNMAKCTGTSFAAPHLAGLLMKGLPDTSAQVSTDIDTIDPQTGQADARKKDRIGACTANCVVPP
jgi:subtilisin family serine protease